MTTSFQCRSCGNNQGELILDLGVQPLANNLLRPEDLTSAEPKFPLRVFICPACWLLQITDVIPPVRLFTQYLYFSSFSDSMVRHASQAAERFISEFSLDRGSCVIEIASNDGYLLQHFQRTGIPCLGIEPAANIAAVARQKGIETLADFFSNALAQQLAKAGRQADLIIGNNVFAHVPDPNDFVLGLKTLLKPSGRVVLEFPYAVDLIGHNEFDTIYHEHVFYFTLTALVPLFGRHGLSIFQVERLPIHGGSLRIFVGHRAAGPVHSSVPSLLAEERRKHISSLSYYTGFASQVVEIKQALVSLLAKLKASGQSIAAYGASAKGSTLLNFCGLGQETIDFVADRNTHKQGRLTPGTHLPIGPAEQLVERQPGYTLLLTWNFADEILRQQEDYRARGGKFIIPIPQVTIV